MNWDRPILTDSGGFQVFSLADLRKIKEEGVYFDSHIDGSKIFMGPEESMRIQSNLASTIAMAFDECRAPSGARESICRILWIGRPAGWCAARRSMTSAECACRIPSTTTSCCSASTRAAPLTDIRIEHMPNEISELDLDGYAIGGLAVGETARGDVPHHRETVTLPAAGEARVPDGRGNAGQHSGSCGAGRGLLRLRISQPERPSWPCVHRTTASCNLFNAKYELDDRPIEEGCQCPACRYHSRAYIRHLLKAKEMLGMRLCVLHNLYFYNTMMTEIRDAIDEDRFAQYKKEKLAGMEEEKG